MIICSKAFKSNVVLINISKVFTKMTDPFNRFSIVKRPMLNVTSQIVTKNETPF